MTMLSVLPLVAALKFAVLSDTASDMQTEMQTFLDSISNQSGYSFSVGYVDAEHDFGIGSGDRNPAAFQHTSPTPKGRVNGSDTMLIGSGTKTFTAAAVLRLAENGTIALSDPIAPHVDDLMQAALGKGATLTGLLGPEAASVTILQVLRMQSGIADFDVPSLDNTVYQNYSHSTLSPFHLMKLMSETIQPTFVCAPGDCTSYSSTNYVLAGILLLAKLKGATPASWTSYPFASALGLDLEKDFPTLQFLSTGPMSKGGLTTAGSSSAYTDLAQFYSQDASILGWTCGNIATSARDVAAFLHRLLSGSPDHARFPPILANETILKDVMEVWATLDKGWAAGDLQYGAGLMIQNVAPDEQSRSLPTLDEVATYIGHGGDTYAYMSDNGFYPVLNASISVIVNTDSDYRYPSYVATCGIVQIAARRVLGKPLLNLECLPAKTTYECREYFGKKYCHESYRGDLNRSQCEQSCR